MCTTYPPQRRTSSSSSSSSSSKRAPVYPQRVTIYVGVPINDTEGNEVFHTTQRVDVFQEYGHDHEIEVFSLGVNRDGPGPIEHGPLVRASAMEWLDDPHGKSNRASMWLHRQLTRPGVTGIYQAGDFINKSNSTAVGIKAGGYFVTANVVRSYLSRNNRRIHNSRLDRMNNMSTNDRETNRTDWNKLRVPSNDTQISTMSDLRLYVR